MRSQDFERIHIEFCDYYKDPVKGDREYYDWLRALSLDESKPYGASQESFKWAKTMLRQLKEDAEAKYYGIIVSLPILSMNGNLYRERDLIAASTTIRGKSPSINHKDEFWLSHKNPRNKWGPPVTIEDSKYEDGATEAILRVPKATVCPVCNPSNKPLYQMIDEQGIVNVSLEGTNNGAFEYSDPPFTLLTSNVLPGIPLARIKPLEKVVSEAFTVTKLTGNKKTVIKAKIVEEIDTSTLGSNFKGNPNGLTADAQIHTQTDHASVAQGTPAVSDNYKMTSGSPMTDKSVTLPNKEAACPTGTKFNPESGKCEPCDDETTKEEVAPAFLHTTAVGTQNDTSMPKPETPMTGPPKTKIPNRDNIAIPDGAPSSFPNTPSLDKVVVGSAPHESLPTLEERKAKVVAELKAANSEERALKWEEQYNELYPKYMQQTGVISQQNITIKGLTESKDEAIRELHNKEVERDQWRSKCEHEMALREEYKSQVENYKNEVSRISEKYNTALTTNLELSKKLTTANEDYLNVAQKLEAAEDALGRAKNEAKRITRIQA